MIYLLDTHSTPILLCWNDGSKGNVDTTIQETVMEAAQEVNVYSIHSMQENDCDQLWTGLDVILKEFYQNEDL